MSEFYIRSGSQQRGPFSRAQLESHPVFESTPVRREGSDQWRPASEFPELSGLLRGDLNEQYGGFRDPLDSSPYKSPQAAAVPVGTDEAAGSIPKVLGMASCGLGVLAWILMLGFVGFIAYTVITEGQGRAEPPEPVILIVGFSSCFSFLAMLAGALVGIVGVAIPGTGKLWSIAGLVLCGLPLLLLLGLFLIGVAFA